MKRHLNMLGLLSVGIVLAGCDYNRPQPTSQGPADQSYYMDGQTMVAGGNYPLHPFKKVVVSGNVNTTIKSGQSQDIINAYGKPSSLNKLAVVQKGDVIYVSSTARHPVNVDINEQSGQTPLHLILSGNSHTTMSGNFLIQQIDAGGKARLDLYWMNTSYLTINAKDSSKLFLAGVATHLDVTASDRAEVNGKYLRAEDSYVMATGNSSVGVNAKSTLGTQSMGNANVYYFRDPESSGIYLRDSGSALRMKGVSTSSNNLLD
jgi:hypothetical protein